jgi:hypothetical protein
VALLAQHVDIGTDGLNVRLRVDGLGGLACAMLAGNMGAAARQARHRYPRRSRSTCRSMSRSDGRGAGTRLAATASVFHFLDFFGLSCFVLLLLAACKAENRGEHNDG